MIILVIIILLFVFTFVATEKKLNNGALSNKLIDRSMDKFKISICLQPAFYTNRCIYLNFYKS